MFGLKYKVFEHNFLKSTLDIKNFKIMIVFEVCIIDFRVLHQYHYSSKC